MPGVSLRALAFATVLANTGPIVIPPPVARAATVIPIGDSRVPVFLDPATKRQKGATELCNVACALADQKYRVKDGYGISGATVPTYLANLNAALAQQPGVIFFISVLNSLAANVSGADCATLILNAANTAIASGAVVVVGSEMGSTALTAPQLAQAVIYNDLIKAAAAVTVGLRFVDLRPTMCTANVIKAEYRYDSGHLNQNGALVAGAIIKTEFDLVMPAGPSFVLGNDNLPAIGGYTNIALNPRLQVATGGASTTGATGSFSANHNFNKTPPTVASPALAVVSTVGNARMTCTFGAQNENCRVSTTASNTAWAAGDTVRGMALIDVSSPVNLAGVQCSLVCNTDAGVLTWTDMSATATWQGPTGAYHMLLLTQEYVIPAHTTKNSLALTIQANSFGVGSAVIDLKQDAILKKNP